ncbi:MAG: 30S ribosomal protein S27e [Conexivisphaerales archaeon]|jgi:small subunit ribosomal protein S27e
MVRKERQLFVRPGSAFLQVKCKKCGTEKVIYSNATVTIRCEVCEEVLAEPSGGRTIISGVITRRLD